MARKVKDKELEARLARALADYDNLVKRVEREKEEFAVRATKNLIEDLLPVIDDFERASEHLQDEGLKMALDQLYRILAKYGVEEIPTRPGDKFDSTVHEALDTANGGKTGTIAKVLLKGYRWQDGQVLRPAKVQVYGEEPKKEEELDKEMIRGDYV